MTKGEPKEDRGGPREDHGKTQGRAEGGSYTYTEYGRGGSYKHKEPGRGGSLYIHIRNVEGEGAINI